MSYGYVMATNTHGPSEDSPRHAGEPGTVGLDHLTVVPEDPDDEE
jgi:hypothetical protein